MKKHMDATEKIRELAEQARDLKYCDMESLDDINRRAEMYLLAVPRLDTRHRF